MANVARQSAEVVSDQMTAVWNNFYDGSKSLEHYADVMTALGAATASSTDEIAGGLEKFAAIGNTIGLSFEYAASALATITSNTRQSEEVVGTALKTVFARIQGLTLGETLEDGTNLNKYSEALKKVGISIYDSAGELKNMDNILDEMAAKWDKLSSA
jgi:TP901 family phage tail tape measure protein